MLTFAIAMGGLSDSKVPFTLRLRWPQLFIACLTIASLIALAVIDRQASIKSRAQGTTLKADRLPVA